MKNICASLLLLGIATTLFGAVVNTPEIDGSTASGAITLVCGAVLVLRSRRKR
jgi:uncharacterized membrane protein YdcZ (DUF606 family)